MNRLEMQKGLTDRHVVDILKEVDTCPRERRPFQILRKAKQGANLGSAVDNGRRSMLDKILMR